MAIHKIHKEPIMKPSEILRSLADMIDAQQSQSLGKQGAVPAKVLPKDSYDQPDQEIDDYGASPNDVFLPPLQLKLELLKKATGVDNVYDEEDAEEDEESHSYDELAHIKRNAGINAVVIDALGDDEPLEG